MPCFNLVLRSPDDLSLKHNFIDKSRNLSEERCSKPWDAPDHEFNVNSSCREDNAPSKPPTRPNDLPDASGDACRAQGGKATLHAGLGNDSISLSAWVARF